MDTINIHNNPTKEHNTKNNMMFPNISTIVTTQAYTMMNIQSFKPSSILFLLNVFLRVPMSLLAPISSMGKRRVRYKLLLSLNAHTYF